MSSVHFPPSISVPLFSPSPPLPPTKGRLLGNPSPLDTAGLVTMAANSQSFSLSLSLPCFSVCTCSHILTVMWEGCPCSPWAFPGPAGEQSTCEQNSNAATGGKRLLCHALGMAHFSTFHMQPVSRESFCAIVHHMADFLFSHWAVCALRNEPHSKAWHTDMFVSVQTHWKQRVNVLIIPGNEIWELIFT